MNLYLSTISRLLVMSVISSGTLKKLRSSNHITHNTNRHRTSSVITSLVIYAMCSIRLPPKILEHLDKLRRYCPWAKNTDDGPKAISLAAWNLVCCPKENGGLGIIDLQIQNQGLLLKQLHKFYNSLDVPWVNLIWSTYSEGLVPHASDQCGSFWWRDIMQLATTYRGVTSVEVRDENTVLF